MSSTRQHDGHIILSQSIVHNQESGLHLVQLCWCFSSLNVVQVQLRNLYCDWLWVQFGFCYCAVKQREDLKVKCNEEHVKRQKIINEVQEAKGNMRVFGCCRPLSNPEVAAGCAYVVDFHAARDGELEILSNGSAKNTFKFDCVYTLKDDQG